MKISKIEDNKKRYMSLLFLADEQEDMIDRYLEKGTMYVLEENGVKAECVVTDEGSKVLEIKNIAVLPECQRMGYGKRMIEFALSRGRQSQVLCKPPGWCRIEAPHRRITIWPERIVPRKKMPVERRSESCCRWQTSAAWMTSRICLRRPLPSSWRMAWRLSWMTNWATASMTTRTRIPTTAA